MIPKTMKAAVVEFHRGIFDCLILLNFLAVFQRTMFILLARIGHFSHGEAGLDLRKGGFEKPPQKSNKSNNQMVRLVWS
jgi:hypothetical protein